MIDFLSRASSPLKNRPVRAPGLQYMAISEEILSAACPHAANETFFNRLLEGANARFVHQGFVFQKLGRLLQIQTDPLPATRPMAFRQNYLPVRADFICGIKTVKRVILRSS